MYFNLQIQDMNLKKKSLKHLSKRPTLHETFQSYKWFDPFNIT